MLDIPVKDSRGFFILPQAPEEAAYYTYGTPTYGQGQYAHPTMLSTIFMVESRWSALDNRRFGVGNISLANGAKFKPHATHKSGLEVDIRPLRKDGKELAVNYFDAQYDREATRKLINLFLQTGLVRNVYFNDLSIPRVKRLDGHDNHFHLDVIA